MLEVEGSTCVSQDVLVATQYVNAILACLIDITTALVPQFLLWNVRMNRRTKISLDIIFALGLITAGLSIGRAATSNAGIWETDTSWRIIPSNTFTLVEDKCGIIFASCPALRQFFAYRRRLGTSLPSTQHRQPPNADFESMRMRINVRDIFWYRKPLASEPGKPIRDPRPIFQKRSQAEVDAERSALDNAENKFMDNMENISRPTHPGSSNTLTGWLRDKGDLLKTPASRRGKNVAMERLPSSSEHLSRPSDPFQRPSPYVVDRRNQGT
ncbi:MAG: hypothetical protein M1831_006556 [Alyxoria varia]|nr:MAG: hypothetical protein M1831_006556 [Alyxoria varia]